MSSEIQTAEASKDRIGAEIAIRVSNLSKIYHIYDRPVDRLKQSTLPRIRNLIGLKPRNYHGEFGALKDVSFEVKRGETVGIIGRNGSGKSTLLQMICGTLTPSIGNIETYGRVAALLELGSGFNPEFTGKENVYFNASVLGLNQEEIDARYDEIVAFADIGDFIDQPVKTYSSGMMVRLAFAVIAHVDADILVIDEALAVGDAIFTQKCMRFIRAFKERGTLLFVSHDIGAVQNLCQSAIWLAAGSIEMQGDSKIVAEEYLRYTMQAVYGESRDLLPNLPKKESVEGSKEVPNNKINNPVTLKYGAKLANENNIEQASGWKTGAAEIVTVELQTSSGKHIDIFEGGEQVRMVVEAIAYEDLYSPILGFLFRDKLGQDLFGENTLPFTAIKPMMVDAGETFHAYFEFILPMLPNGQYAVMASVATGDLHNHTQHHYLNDALIVNVSSSKVRWGLVGLNFSKVLMGKK